MISTIKTSLGTVLSYNLDTLLIKRNKALTLEYWTSKEYKMHQRINERDRLAKQYSAKAGFIAGMLINACLYKISNHANQLLIQK